jgi:hypothetical protein
MSESKHGSISIVHDAYTLAKMREREALYYQGNSTEMSCDIGDVNNVSNIGGAIDDDVKKIDALPNKTNSRISSTANNVSHNIANNTSHNTLHNTLHNISRNISASRASNKAYDNIDLTKFINPELVKESCYSSLNKDTPFKFSSIRDINKPGIYLIKCLVHNYTLVNTENGLCLILTLRDTDDTLKVMARRKLVKLLINSRMLSMNLQFMCMMILCLDVEKVQNYLINTFFEDGGLIDIIGKHNTLH